MTPTVVNVDSWCSFLSVIPGPDPGINRGTVLVRIPGLSPGMTKAVRMLRSRAGNSRINQPLRARFATAAKYPDAAGRIASLKS
jgi:hypothetical protein